MFLQQLSPCFISVGIVKEIQLTSSFLLSLPENHHPNIKKCVQLVKWNGITEIKIPSGEKGRGSDSQLAGRICAPLKLCCWPSPQKRDSQTRTDWKTWRLYFLKKWGTTKSSTIWPQTALFYTYLHSMNSSFQPNWPACHYINMLCAPDFSLSVPTTCMPFEPPSYKE